MRTATRRNILTTILACAAAAAAGGASADDSPRSYKASPDVYKVVAEHDRMRVIAATWKPGQRDQWHSHPAAALYWLTDCTGRTYLPDGKFLDRNPKAGSAVVQPAVKSHSFENRSGTECKAIIFEQE